MLEVDFRPLIQGAWQHAVAAFVVLLVLCLPKSADAQIVLDPTFLQFEVVQGDQSSAQDVTLFTGCDVLNVGRDWTAEVDLAEPPFDWLSVTPEGSNATEGVPITISIDSTGLAPGIFSASITVSVDTDCDGVPITPISMQVGVTLEVHSFAHIVSPTQLVFNHLLGSPPPFDTFIYSAGCAPPGRTWEVLVVVAPPGQWLLTNFSGGQSGETNAGVGETIITVFVDPNGLTPGQYFGTITIESSTDCDGNSSAEQPDPNVVAVTLNLAVDTDDDGVEDDLDNCPTVPNGEDQSNIPGVGNQTDSDEDGLGDACDNCPDVTNENQDDGDSDGAGDACDNCPAVENSDQANNDGDTLGDLCDNCPAETNENQLDGDDDGAGNVCDGCPNDADKQEPGDCGCGELETDSDDDGTADCIDLCPDDPGKIEPGVCDCGISDIDLDEDGVADCEDVCLGEDDNLDSDGDGTVDCMEDCPFDSTKLEAGLCGCGQSDVDSDADGVADCNDDCLGTPIGSPNVDAGGCLPSQRDSDDDGVTDDIDECPNTPTGLFVDPNGCTPIENDIDRDGLPNTIDECPDTPPGQATNADGCADFQLDSDEDGVIDTIDQCPLTPPNDTVDSFGCSIALPVFDTDSDGDGVLDIVDDCADTPIDAAVDASGCPLPPGSGPEFQSDPTDACGAGTCGSTGTLTLILMLAGLSLIRRYF